MKIKLSSFAVFVLVGGLACSSSSVNTPAPGRVVNSNASATPATAATASPASSPAVSTTSNKNGDYEGKGTVTKINMELGSVEMDHDDIPNLMPAMRMEFYVSDKKMLNGIAVGDRVDFRLRYKDGTETVVKLDKAR